MVINQIGYVATLAALGGLIACACGGVRRESVGLAAFFELSFGLRAAAVFANEAFNLLPQKFAGDIVLGLINQPGGVWSLFHRLVVYGRDTTNPLKFVPEAIANIPGIRVFENSYVILDLTNCLVGAISGLLVFAYLRRLIGVNAAIFGMLLTSFYPAAFNFSIFGVRDIFLYLCILLNIASIFWLSMRSDHRYVNILVYVISMAFLYVMRSAFAPFMVVLPMFVLVRGVLKRLSGVEDPRRRLLLSGAVAVVATVTTGMALAAGYWIVLHHLGIGQAGRPDRVFRGYVEARASCGTPYAQARDFAHSIWSRCVPIRHVAGDRARGVASQYIPFAIYKHTPLILREFVQEIGFLVIPLPWQIDRWSRALALADSAFVIATLCAAWRACQMSPRRLENPLQTLSEGLLLSFVLCWLGFGLLVTDAGNAFRLRLTIEPFAIFGASLYLSRLTWLNRATDQALERLYASVPGKFIRWHGRGRSAS